MNRNFEYDASGHVAVALAVDTGDYINDRIQEFHGTRYGMLIDETAELIYPKSDAHNSIVQRLAYFAGATVVLDALSYSDLDNFQIDYMKHAFICGGQTKESKSHKPNEIKEQIELSALVGISSHTELQHISDTVGSYYARINKNINVRTPVFLGVGRTAFVLDNYFKSLIVSDPKFEILHTLKTMD
jgi:hypothetical protein